MRKDNEEGNKEEKGRKEGRKELADRYNGFIMHVLYV